MGWWTNAPNQTTLYKDLQAMGYSIKPLTSWFPGKTNLPSAIILEIWPGAKPLEIQQQWLYNILAEAPVICVVSEELVPELSRWLPITPMALLLRPLRLLQLQLTIQNVALRSGHHKKKKETPSFQFLNDSIFLREGTRFIRMPMKEILFLAADRRYCKVVTSTNSYLHTLPLNSLMDQLPESRFIRVHRSFGVQLNAITALTSKNLFINDRSIPIGEQYKEVVREQLFQLTLKSG